MRPRRIPSATRPLRPTAHELRIRRPFRFSDRAVEAIQIALDASALRAEELTDGTGHEQRGDCIEKARHGRVPHRGY